MGRSFGASCLGICGTLTHHSIVSTFGSMKRVDKETLDGEVLLFARVQVEVKRFLKV